LNPHVWSPRHPERTPTEVGNRVRLPVPPPPHIKRPISQGMGFFIEISEDLNPVSLSYVKLSMHFLILKLLKSGEINVKSRDIV
jgi:hypothetical protein